MLTAAVLVGGVASAGMMMVPPAAQLALVAGVLIVVTLGVSRTPVVYLAVAVVLYLFSQTEFSAAFPEAGVATRGAAVVVALMAARLANASRPDKPRELLALAALASSAYATSIVAHGATVTAMLDMAVLIVVCASLYVVVSKVDATSIKMALEVAMWVVLASSALAVLSSYVGALEAGRLTGYLSSSNSLGFFAALAVLLGLLVDGRRMRFMLVVVAAVVLVLTASRASLLALVVATGVTSIRVVVRREPHSQRLIGATAIGGVLAYVVLQVIAATELLIVRTNNSREAGAEYALQARQGSPWTGIGYDQSESEIASTPLRWLAEGGYVGLGLVLLSYAVLLIWSWWRSWQAFLVAAFGVTHSLFEGWLFAGGSGLFLTFWLLYYCASATSTGALHHASPDSTASARDGRSRSVGPGLSGAVSAVRQRHPRLG